MRRLQKRIIREVHVVDPVCAPSPLDDMHMNVLRVVRIRIAARTNGVETILAIGPRESEAAQSTMARRIAAFGAWIDARRVRLVVRKRSRPARPCRRHGAPCLPPPAARRVRSPAQGERSKSALRAVPRTPPRSPRTARRRSARSPPPAAATPSPSRRGRGWIATALNHSFREGATSTPNTRASKTVPGRLTEPGWSWFRTTVGSDAGENRP